MAYIPRSSLIPNETSGAIPIQIRKKKTIHAFGLIATLLFILSLLGAIGIFVYKDVLLTEELTKAKDELAAASSASESYRQIEELRVYNDRLRIAEGLLDNHIAPSRIFEELENSTKGTIQYKSLEFVHDPGFEAMLMLSGNTAEFSSVALQKMQLFEDEVFSEFVLQDLISAGESEEAAETQAGGVTFKVVGIFKKDMIAYGEGEREPSTSDDAARPVSDPEAESSTPTGTSESTGTTTEPASEATSQTP